MKKIILSLLILVSISGFSQTPKSRATLTTTPYSWGMRQVPVIGPLRDTWASFHNIVDDGAAATATNSMAFTNKSGNISQWTNNSGYLTTTTLTAWDLSGNAPTTHTTFAGTTNARSYSIKVNNTLIWKADSTTFKSRFPNYVSIGNSTVAASRHLDIHSTTGFVTGQVWSEDAAGYAIFYAQGSAPSYYIGMGNTGASYSVANTFYRPSAAFIDMTSPYSFIVNPVSNGTLSIAVGNNSLTAGLVNFVPGGSNFTSSLTVRTGTDVVYHNFQSLTTATTIPAYYLGQAVPNGTNYAIVSDGTLNAFNSPTDLVFKSRGTNMYFGNSLPSGSQAFHEFFGLTMTGVTSAQKRRFSIGGNSIQFLVGNFATQQSVFIQGDTYSATGNSTITTAVSLQVDPPINSTSLTITNKLALLATGNTSITGYIATPTVSGNTSTLNIMASLTSTTGLIQIGNSANTPTINIGNAAVNTTSLGNVRIGQGTSFMDFGQSQGAFPSIWLQQTTPSTSNYAIAADVNQTYLNGPSAISMGYGNSAKITVSSTGIKNSMATRIGSATAPSATLDVTGTAAISGTTNIGVAATNTTALGIVRIGQGTDKLDIGTGGYEGAGYSCFWAGQTTPTANNPFLQANNNFVNFNNGTSNIGAMTWNIAANIRAIMTNTALTYANIRVEFAKGANTAAANDLTLPSTGNLFHITGATQINAITTSLWQAGSEITLIFDSTPTVKCNTAGGAGTAVLLLSLGVDFVATPNDVLKLVYDGTSWFEVSRSIN